MCWIGVILIQQMNCFTIVTDSSIKNHTFSRLKHYSYWAPSNRKRKNKNNLIHSVFKSQKKERYSSFWFEVERRRSWPCFFFSFYIITAFCTSSLSLFFICLTQHTETAYTTQDIAWNHISLTRNFNPRLVHNQSTISAIKLPIMRFHRKGKMVKV